MRRLIILALALAGAGCATLTPEGKSVKVYQADVTSADQPAPPLPDGCKRLKEWGPIDQQQEAREISDPYLQERNTTAAAGGNVLYLRSFRFKNLMKIDCPVGNTSPGCMDSEQSWYKVTFESYACDAGALAELATAPPPTVGSIFKWELKKKTPAATVAPPPAAPAASVGACGGCDAGASSRRRRGRNLRLRAEGEGSRAPARGRRSGRHRLVRSRKPPVGGADGRRDHRLEEVRDPGRGHSRDVSELRVTPKPDFTSFLQSLPSPLTGAAETRGSLEEEEQS